MFLIMCMGMCLTVVELEVAGVLSFVFVGVVSVVKEAGLIVWWVMTAVRMGSWAVLNLNGIGRMF